VPVVLEARDEITVENPDGVRRGATHAELDGRTLTEGPRRVPLADDGQTHEVRVILGSPTSLVQWLRPQSRSASGARAEGGVVDALHPPDLGPVRVSPALD